MSRVASRPAGGSADGFTGHSAENARYEYGAPAFAGACLHTVGSPTTMSSRNMLPLLQVQCHCEINATFLVQTFG